MSSDGTQKLRHDDPTDVVLFLYACLFFLYGAHQFFFGDPVTPEEHVFAKYVVLSCGVIVVVFVFLAIVKCYHHKKNLNELQQCRNFMLISLGGFAVFGFFPRIVVPFCSGSFLNTTIGVSLGGIFPLSIFYLHLKQSCRTTVSWTDFSSWRLFYLLIHILVLFFESKKFVSLLFFVICFMSTTEFLNVWKGKIEMTDEDKGEILEWLLVPQTTRFKCNLCNKKYNRTTRIPRMLKECGHTICEECGDRLRNENTRTLQCPFCQVVTFNEGPANRLPKNFALMETVELNSFRNLIDV